MEFGKGEAYRHAGWLERAAPAFRHVIAGSVFERPLKLAYEAVLDRLPGDRLVCRFPGGESIRLAAAYRQITWNAEEYAAFRRDVAPGDVVLDVGANLGAYSMLFGQWVGNEGRVFAFEPAPDARFGLERHVRLNDLAGRVIPRAEAMSGKTGTARFRASGPRGDNRLTSSDADAIDVQTTSIDAVCRDLHLAPRVIKIDVEGAELNVLRGARDTIAAAGSALKLYVEMHPHLWPSFGTSQVEVEAELERQRLTPERLDGNPDVWSIEGVCLRLRPCAS